MKWITKMLQIGGSGNSQIIQTNNSVVNGDLVAGDLVKKAKKSKLFGGSTQSIQSSDGVTTTNRDGHITISGRMKSVTINKKIVWTRD